MLIPYNLKPVNQKPMLCKPTCSNILRMQNIHVSIFIMDSAKKFAFKTEKIAKMLRKKNFSELVPSSFFIVIPRL